MKRYNPLLTLVTVQVDRVEEISKGGIVIAAQGSREVESKAEGTILEIGPNAYEDYGDVQIKPGDRVVFSRFAGKELMREEAGSKEVRIMHDKDILAKIHED